MTENEKEMTGKEYMESEAERKKKREEIRERFNEVVFPDPIMEPIYFGRTHKTAVQGKRLMRDAKSGAQYAVVSKKYHTVFHEDVVRNLIEAVPEEFGNPVFNVKMLNHGARMRAEVTFPDIDKKVNGSELDLMGRVGNSYDTSLQLGWEWGAKELVCENGLIAFVTKEQSKARHIYGAISRMQITDNLNAALEDFSDQHNIWLKWNETKLTELQIDEALTELPFSDPEKEKLKELPLMNHNNTAISSMKEPTLWTLNSAATQYAKHEVTSLKRSYELENKIAAAMASLSYIWNRE